MKHFLIKSAVCLAVIGIMMLAGCASQDEMFMMDDRLTSLEQRHEAMQQELAQTRSGLTDLRSDKQGDAAQIRNRSAALRVDVDALRDEVQRLSGQLDESLFLLRQKMAALDAADRKRQAEMSQLEERIGENTDQIQGIEQYLSLEKNAPGNQKTQAPAGGADAQGGQLPPEDQLYLSAKKDFDSGQFEAARKSFADLIARFPKSGHADNAQFWIGESYYKEKWYEKAILEYQKVIEKYPKGNKVQASLLKQGFAFLNLGDSANARLILKELIRKYPKSNEAAIAQKKLKTIQ